MPGISEYGRTEVESLAHRTGFSAEAVTSMLQAIVRGGGRMAQFDHPEFGGPGQWMQGGMLMTSDLFDHGLKARIGGLCEALAERVRREPVAADGGTQRQSQTSNGETHVQDSRDDGGSRRSTGESAPGSWYPASLGAPASSGSQNRTRYAWFPETRRLAIDDGDGVRLYDTGDHRIGGVSQQQGSHGTLAFTSQHGTVDVDRLLRVDGDGPAPRPSPGQPSAPADAGQGPDASPGDPFAALEKLAALHARGIVDDAEFAAKKAELLRRI